MGSWAEVLYISETAMAEVLCDIYFSSPMSK